MTSEKPSERSAGAIIFRIVFKRDIKRDKEIIYLLLHYKNKADEYKSAHAKVIEKYWEFSRGNIEKGETEKETAMREVNEETGLTGLKFLPEFKKKIEWFYMRDGKIIHKEVTLFLAETDKEDITISHEHVGYGWFNYKNAMNKLSFLNSKEALTSANKFLTDNFAIPN